MSITKFFDNLDAPVQIILILAIVIDKIIEKVGPQRNCKQTVEELKGLITNVKDDIKEDVKNLKEALDSERKRIDELFKKN